MFISIASQFQKGFFVETTPPDIEKGHCASLRLVCIDSSIPMKKVSASFKSVVLLGHSLFPNELNSLLDIECRFVEIPVLYRDFNPIIVTKGSDQMPDPVPSRV